MRTVGLLLLLSCYTLFYAQERALYEGKFETKSTGVFLPVKIAGKECKFLFDTGASLVVLDKKFKDLLGGPLSLKETQERTGVSFTSNKIITPNGELSLELYKALPLKLGKLQIANKFPYLLADLQSLWPFSGVEFCGILGSSFLQQFRWELNFKEGEIKAYIGMEPYMGKYRSKKPIHWSNVGIPYVGVNIYGRKIAFDIDLGDNGNGRIKRENLLFLKKNSQVLKTHIQDVVTVSSISQSEEFRLRSIRFAGIDYPDILMQESQQNALGLAFFKRHNIVLDFPFNMLYLQHHKDYVKREELDKSGIRVILKDKSIRVFSVKPLGGALVEGIKKGDKIISINGKRDLLLYEIRELLRSKEGTRLSLEINRDGSEHRANIILGADPLQ